MSSLPRRFFNASAFLTTLAAACLMFGAIPWLTVPTLGQAVWASGFALSFANADLLSIYAHDFGLPNPAPIAFGLSATLLQAALVRFSVASAMDAYTLTVVVYLAISLWGASAYARQLGSTYGSALWFGLLWICLPIVVQHAGYSMLALGFALLPFYLNSLHGLLWAESARTAAVAGIGYVMACMLAVFMDGYTFVMFAVASACVIAGALATVLIPTRRLLLQVAPTIAAGLTTAYLSYSAYIGGYRFEPAPLDFFRGWGVDVLMWFIPTRGMHWLWDTLGLSAPRDMAHYWGDASVWMTTFIAPLLATGLAGFIIAKQRKYALILGMMAVAGLYLSLGPSLKFHSTKEAAGITAEERQSQLMPAKYARAPAGTAPLFEKVPGVNVMRATYRWIGLGVLGLWGLTILLTHRLQGARPVQAALVAPLLVLMLLPNVGRQTKSAMSNRGKAASMESALVDDLRQVASGGVVFFAPHGNDFIANYWAPLAGIKTYNIGGDKNMLLAQRHWSEPMLRLGLPQLSTASFPQDVRTVLLTGQADVVVIPFFDMLQSAIHWPPSSTSITTYRTNRMPIMLNATAGPCFQVEERALFVAAKLAIPGKEVRNLYQTSAPQSAVSKALEACATSPLPPALPGLPPTQPES